jgi:hypothetical protein
MGVSSERDAERRHDDRAHVLATPPDGHTSAAHIMCGMRMDPGGVRCEACLLVRHGPKDG